MSSRLGRARAASYPSSLEPSEPLPIRLQRYSETLKDFSEDWEIRMKVMVEVAEIMSTEVGLNEEMINSSILLVPGLMSQLKENRSAVSGQASKTLSQLCLTLALVTRFQFYLPRIYTALSERLPVTISMISEAATNAIVEIITGVPIDLLPQLNSSLLESMTSPHQMIKF